ncbi:hypothetical protein NFI96_001915 [Prochilodus magdalenae]|nr:hypothetical protein NFI96_001915 [Prochilodus magdalenae]
MQLEHPHTVPADGAVGVEVEGHQVLLGRVTTVTNKPVHLGASSTHGIRWASPPRLKRDPSLKMTRCHSESLHDSLSCVVQPSANGAALTGGHHCSLDVCNGGCWVSPLMGSLVLAVGLWLRLEQDTVALLGGEGAPENFFIGVYILIVAGGLVMLVGFFGCCGAVRESQCLLGLFFACLLIIFGAEVAAGVFGFLNKEKIVQDIQTFYKESAKDTNSNNTAILSSYHRVLNCCGTSTTQSTQCPNVAPDTKDCDSAIEEFFNSKLFIIAYVGIGIAGVMYPL